MECKGRCWRIWVPGHSKFKWCLRLIWLHIKQYWGMILVSLSLRKNKMSRAGNGGSRSWPAVSISATWPYCMLWGWCGLSKMSQSYVFLLSASHWPWPSLGGSVTLSKVVAFDQGQAHEGSSCQVFGWDILSSWELGTLTMNRESG